MYKIGKISGLCVVWLMLGLWTQTIFAQNFPKVPNRLVSDFTNSLSAEEVNQLERKLLLFEDSTTIQLAVVLIPSTGDYEIADYAVRLAQNWGIGNAKYNSGILLLAAINDRAVTLQTGYGIEGALPDVIARRIIENEIKPAFQVKAYSVGLNAATDAIIAYTKGEYKADPKTTEEGSPWGAIILFIVIFILIVFFKSRGGGGGNGGGRVMNGKGSSDLFWWTLLNQLGQAGRSSGGGFGGGFGGGGGGFGGFGGGGFGGGGASGRW